MGNKVRVTVVLEVPTDEKDWQIEAEEGLDWAREETIRILRGAGRRRDGTSVQLDHALT
jgi:hypothetical protein